MRNYFLAWELGQVPSGDNIDSMDDEEVELLSSLIMVWKHYDKAEDFNTLAIILGGKQ